MDEVKDSRKPLESSVTSISDKQLWKPLARHLPLLKGSLHPYNQTDIPSASYSSICCAIVEIAIFLSSFSKAEELTLISNIRCFS